MKCICMSTREILYILIEYRTHSGISTISLFLNMLLEANVTTGHVFEPHPPLTSISSEIFSVVYEKGRFRIHTSSPNDTRVRGRDSV